MGTDRDEESAIDAEGYVQKRGHFGLALPAFSEGAIWPVVAAIALGTALSWIGIAVLIWLYMVAISQPGASNDVRLDYPMIDSTTGKTIPTQSIVSFDGNGGMVKGAGTSIYKNVTVMNTFCPKWIDVDAIFSDSFIATYQNLGASSTVFKVIQLTDGATKERVYEESSDSRFYKVATLDQSSGIFIGISESNNFAPYTNFITAGSVNRDSQDVNLGSPVLYSCPEKGVTNPYLTRLSATTFAISSFCADANYASSLITQYGVVNPTTLDVTLSATVTYASVADAPGYHQMVALTASTYLVMWRKRSVGTLTVRKVTVVDAQALQISLSPTVVLSSLKMSTIQYWETARVDDNTAMVVYVDDSTDGGLTAVLVDATANDLTPIRVGSSMSISTGNSQVSKYSEYYYLGVWYPSPLAMDFAVTVIGATDVKSSATVMVLYADVANGAKWTAAMIEVTKANEIVRASPHFVLNKDSTKGIDSDQSHTPDNKFKALRFEAALGASSDSRIAMFTTMSDDSCSTVATSDFSVVEVKSAVRGVVVAEDALSIAGVVGGFSGLRPGYEYYANTRGELIEGQLSLGKGYSASLLLTDYIETSTSIIALNSLVGVALSTSAISIGK